MVPTVVDDIVALRAASLAGYDEVAVDTDEALASMRDKVAATLRRADVIRTLEGRAAVVFGVQPSPIFGEQPGCMIELDVNDPGALAWVVDQMRMCTPHVDAKLQVELTASYDSLLAPLAELGLRPRMLLLHGSPTVALEALRAGGIARDVLEDFDIEPLSSRAQVDQLFELMRGYHLRYPEHGYLNPRIEITEHMQNKLDTFTRNNYLEALELGTAYVLLRAGRVMGYGEMHPHDDAQLGCTAGIGIGIGRQTQGRGFSKLIYEKLLVRMIELGVVAMKGRSANPAVLHLAKRMKRPLRGYLLEPM